jgi:hypothetical protein
MCQDVRSSVEEGLRELGGEAGLRRANPGCFMGHQKLAQCRDFGDGIAN